MPALILSGSFNSPETNRHTADVRGVPISVRGVPVARTLH